MTKANTVAALCLAETRIINKGSGNKKSATNQISWVALPSPKAFNFSGFAFARVDICSPLAVLTASRHRALKAWSLKHAAARLAHVLLSKRTTAVAGLLAIRLYGGLQRTRWIENWPPEAQKVLFAAELICKGLQLLLDEVRDVALSQRVG